ncbi:L-threonylcarbamoyladenylate synthase [Methanolinea mesophila]|uniref:L-threonylcarbamoyladenylate synthase n=1 Tax=Methanolinea mesophila TaxID=547055 RepID=UPI001AE55510|nr:L-threonylcarbamoyladenylate synthase [Methanolinea mesophila]MBP1927619.1 L-threonylcarbamoyladenylate synthase [Methanolinea mesophila]
MDIIDRAVQVLRQDGLVVYPTETIYGLGGDALSEEAILKVYEAKQRLLSKPISIAVSSEEMICWVARVDDLAGEFIDRFLPGPVTVILPAKKVIPEMLTVGLGKVGIRFPDHPLALQLIDRFDAPITATSANISGGRDPVTPEECRAPHDLLIDGGRLPGTPSTVVDLTSMEIVRPGAMLEEVAGFLAGAARK